MAQITPIKYCPERDPVVNPQHWYFLPAAKALKICTRCYHDRLSATPFARQFQVEYYPSGDSRYCDFNNPRMHSVLQQAVAQNNFQLLHDHIVYRSQIPRCKGEEIVKPDDGFEWFKPLNPALKDKFAACRACYEDYLIPAGFAPQLSAPIRQEKELNYMCDMGFRFCLRLATTCRDWNQMISYAVHRAGLPKCTGLTPAEASSGKWYKLRPNDLDSLLFCEACYYDFASMTIMEPHVYLPQQQPQPNTQINCAVSGWPSMRSAWEQALNKKDFNTFYAAAQVFVRNPPCLHTGITKGTWYTLKPPCDEVDICASCYAGIFVVNDVGHFLAQKWTQPGQTRLCNMNLHQPRAMQLYQKLDAAITANDEKMFSDFARWAAETPLCPGGALVNDRMWYRHETFSCCPSCWMEVIDGTPLESAFPVRNQLYKPQLKCDFYSARVRGLWMEACQKNDLPGFVAFMDNRLKIWSQTYPLIQQHLATMRMNMMRQQTLFMSSTILNGGNSIAAAAGVSGNYGNSQVGYGWETYAGAEGAMQFNQAMSMNGANGSVAMSIAQLEGLWKSVE
ncbi:hypothetical protein H072_10731 [Dactylellina haptotyla CBS 200.50]|uniref:Integral membrane protein n=1 Tax=Dactylellina haptotyla (strain CBS 200.50) TaxID=1284197 RepID=S7ZYH0_DACHA|nr:hypothetical protein H072_10731 [Dactylellina haptotyla CBS 200.50]